jgi:5-methylcytosine-specific restriction endonuclease McrA
MRVIDQDTGQPFDLYSSDELREELRAYREQECRHPDMEIRRVTVVGGATQFRMQCQSCGTFQGQAIPHSSVSDVSPHDAALPVRYRQKREDEYSTIIQRHVWKQKGRDTAWWQKYKDHLKSPGWKAKRLKVLQRAQGQCEGCAERPANEVHHLTYEHVCEEFLFELVALCSVCHARIHPREEAEFENEWRDGFPCDGCRWQDERDQRRWCGKFDVRATVALSSEGPCGPNHAELVPLK